MMKPILSNDRRFSYHSIASTNHALKTMAVLNLKWFEHAYAPLLMSTFSRSRLSSSLDEMLVIRARPLGSKHGGNRTRFAALIGHWVNKSTELSRPRVPAYVSACVRACMHACTKKRNKSKKNISNGMQFVTMASSVLDSRSRMETLTSWGFLRQSPRVIWHYLVH